MQHISLVIRCYNEEEHIGRLLCGVMEQTITNIEIIIVDSGSTDATLSIASRYPTKIIQIDPDEFSFGHSLNVGCQAASGDYIVIASAHVYPGYKEWIKDLIRPFENQDVALVYGKQRGNEVTKYAEHQIFKKWFPDKSNYTQAYPFCNNANAAIRRSLWNEFQYNEALTGLEDVDWAKQAMARGYKIAYEANAEVIHVHDEAWKNIYNRYRREAIALKAIVPQEHFNEWDFIRLLAGNIWNDWHSAVHDEVFMRNILPIVAFRFAQFFGTYRGFKMSGPVSSDIKRTFYYPGRPTRTRGTEKKADSERQKIDYSRVGRGDGL